MPFEIIHDFGRVKNFFRSISQLGYFLVKCRKWKKVCGTFEGRRRLIPAVEPFLFFIDLGSIDSKAKTKKDPSSIIKEQVMKTKQKTGFTLIELLVVISIIGMLMGLLLPAVNAARQAAARVQCQNNQKNIALAILNYESAKSEMPSFRKNMVQNFSKFADSTEKTLFRDDWESNWIVSILPYIEQNSLYELFTNKSATSVPVLRVLKCPSSTKDFSPGTAMTSYVVNCGNQNGMEIIDETANLFYEPATSGVGSRDLGTIGKNMGIFYDRRGGASVNSNIFVCDTVINLDFISSADGASKTILLSENEDAGSWITFEQSGSSTRSVSGREWEIGFTLPASVSTITSVATLRNAFLAAVDPNNTASYGPARINVGKNFVPTADAHRYVLARPSSNHVGLVIIAMCDGSVRSISDDIDHAVYAYAVMPKDGTVSDLP